MALQSGRTMQYPRAWRRRQSLTVGIDGENGGKKPAGSASVVVLVKGQFGSIVLIACWPESYHIYFRQVSLYFPQPIPFPI